MSNQLVTIDLDDLKILLDLAADALTYCSEGLTAWAEAPLQEVDQDELESYRGAVSQYKADAAVVERLNNQFRKG